jgi:DNA-binding transcriptional MocR family regulator
MELALDPVSAEPLHRQLQRRLKEGLRRGSLGEGGRLPPVRELAAQCGVNRLTVLKAIRPLQQQGLVRSEPGIGFRVMPAARSAPSALFEPEESDPIQGLAAARAVSREFALATAIDSSHALPFSFAAGLPAPDLLPVDLLPRLAQRVLARSGASELTYQPVEGVPRFRAVLWRYLAAHGITPEGRALLVTSGAQQAIDLFARSLPRATGVALVESPTYFGALAAFEHAGFTLNDVPQDCHGLSVAALMRRLARGGHDFLFINPTFNNPTGLSLSRERRRRVALLGASHALPILEDATYADLGFRGASPPSVAALADGAPVVYVGTFSKSFLPALRLGFAVGPPVLIERMRAVKSINDIFASSLSQAILGECLELGLYEKHLRRVRREYRRRCQAMTEALARELPSGTRFTVPRGGFYIWVALPGKLDAEALQAACQRRGVDFTAGPQFFAGGSGANCLRLNFSLHSEAENACGVAILAEEIRALQNGSATRERLCRQSG